MYHLIQKANMVGTYSFQQEQEKTERLTLRMRIGVSP